MLSLTRDGTCSVLAVTYAHREPSLLSPGPSILLGVKATLQASLISEVRRTSIGQSQKSYNDRMFDNADSVHQICSKSEISEDFGGEGPGIYGNAQSFNRMPENKEAAWKADELWDQHDWNEALIQLDSELEEGRSVSAGYLATLIQHCGDTDDVVRCHQAQQYIVMTGHASNVFLQNKMVELYSMYGSLRASCVVFNSMLKHNVFSWTAIILAHVKHGQAETAVLLFGEMLETGIMPDNVLFVIILKACLNLMSNEKSLEMHACCIEYGFDHEAYVGSTLIFMHVELGNLDYAQTVFDKMREPSVVAWNTLIMGYAEEGLSKEAFTVFRRMREETAPDDVTFLSVMKACITSEDLIAGMDVHAHAIASGLDLHLFVGSSLVDMYAKCGGIEHAYAFFHKLEARNVVSWTAMITGFAQEGTWDLTLELFEQMQSKNKAQPNELTYASALCACSGLRLKEKGRVMHADIVRFGYELDAFIGSTLIDMYANCGCMDDACHTFGRFPTPNTVTYNSMLSGFAQQDLGEEALQLFQKMEGEGLKPDEATFVTILKVCSSMEALEHGKQMHLQIMKDGIESNSVIANGLIVLYSRCGSMEDSHSVFESMLCRDMVSWNELIAGYSLHGPREMALTVFERMQHEGYEPSKVTFVSVVKACANLAALDQGQCICMHMVKVGIDSDMLLDSTVVDFYAKCGCLEDAAYIFMNMTVHDVVSYTAMITAYAQQGRAEDAIFIYECMKEEGLQPNEITFVSVLNACSHAGLVHEALQYFKSMRNVYGLNPTASHCACLVDLLGRAGLHVEAMDLMKHLPADSNEVPLLALLASCRSSHNSEVARLSADNVLEQGSKNAAAYVLLSDISAV